MFAMQRGCWRDSLRFSFRLVVCHESALSFVDCSLTSVSTVGFEWWELKEFLFGGLKEFVSNEDVNEVAGS
jgi:hypothetical protein